ncbi:dTDP-4-dehydrorhamnose 3,5-epimerase [Spirosoma migulaei]
MDGVELRQLNEIADQRGSFTETFALQWGVGISPAQWSIVRSGTNVLRGLHIHQRHDEYFCLLEGHCRVGLYDARPDSRTYQQYALYELFGADMKALIFPAGLLHGWYFLTPSIHLQAVSECYSTYAQDDNLGCRWDDPALNIPWGISDPILSDRAASFPLLTDLMVSLANAELYP